MDFYRNFFRRIFLNFLVILFFLLDFPKADEGAVTDRCPSLVVMRSWKESEITLWCQLDYGQFDTIVWLHEGQKLQSGETKVRKFSFFSIFRLHEGEKSKTS